MNTDADIAMSNEHSRVAAPALRLPFGYAQGKRSVQAIKSLIRKMCLSLYTKVMQQMQHFCIKNVACKDTSAKRYILDC